MFDIKKILYFVFAFLFIPFALNAQEGYINVKYGITSHDSNFTSTKGGSTVDEDDEGYMFSAGLFLIGDNIGLDFMYYDMGGSSIKVNAIDIIRIDGADYLVDQKGGTISNTVDGYGLGIVLASSPIGDGFLNFGIQGKLGLHQWDKSGSTTLLQLDSSIDGRFYDSGTDLYAGLGVNLGLTEAIAINASYDVLGFDDSASSLDSASSMYSVGLTLSF